MRGAVMVAVVALLAAPPGPARAADDDAWLGIIFAPRAGAAGVVIGDVLPGGPAEGAGLDPGDAVVALDGYVLQGPGDLVAAIAQRRVGDVVTLTVLDDVGLRDTIVELGPREADDLVTARRLVGRALPAVALLAAGAERPAPAVPAGQVDVQAWVSAACADCSRALDAVDARGRRWPGTRVRGVVPATIVELRSWRAVAPTALPVLRVADGAPLYDLTIDNGRRGVTLVASRAGRIGAAAYLPATDDAAAIAQRLDEFGAAVARLATSHP